MCAWNTERLLNFSIYPRRNYPTLTLLDTDWPWYTESPLAADGLIATQAPKLNLVGALAHSDLYCPSPNLHHLTIPSL